MLIFQKVEGKYTSRENTVEHIAHLTDPYLSPVQKLKKCLNFTQNNLFIKFGQCDQNDDSDPPKLKSYEKSLHFLDFLFFRFSGDT